MTATRTDRLPAGPPLPGTRGPLSHATIRALLGEQDVPPAVQRAAAGADPYGEDLQLALYLLYELHYRGFAHVAEEREWDARVLAWRALLEQRFLSALRADVPTGRHVSDVFEELLTEPRDSGDSVSHYLQRQGQWRHLREHAAVRSLYHLKEADPHAWVIPRLRGRAKAAMVAVEYDEFGAGRPDNIHAVLYAALMDDLGLDSRYGRYLDRAPAQALATVNMMSLFGLHRALRGALVGHFAWVETTSPPGSRRLAQAMRRIGAGPAAQRFYDEHVEADAVHEQIVRHEMIAGVLDEEPHLAPDIAFGAEATTFLEARLSTHLLTAWRSGHTGLHG